VAGWPPLTREAHASISGRIAETYPPGTDGRALWLNNRAVLLGHVGRREEALAAIEEAVAIRRELARARPTVFASRFAASLENQAVILSALGRDAEAQTARDEAAATRSKP
jgi:tetratricopeptide (TPR) repeat protein